MGEKKNPVKLKRYANLPRTYQTQNCFGQNWGNSVVLEKSKPPTLVYQEVPGVTIFMNVFNSDDPEQHGWGNHSAEQSLQNVDSLDRPISREEVSRAITNLKSGQSSGLDGTLAEML